MYAQLVCKTVRLLEECISTTTVTKICGFSSKKKKKNFFYITKIWHSEVRGSADGVIHLINLTAHYKHPHSRRKQLLSSAVVF